MKCCNYSRLDLIRKGLLIEGGGNETIAFYASEIEAILEDEDMELYGEDDIVVDGPEPGETIEQLNKKTIEQSNGKRRGEKKEEQGIGNKEGKRQGRKKDAAETVTADSPRPSRPSESSQSRDLALTPEQIRQGQSRVLRLIQQRTPPDIPTLIRACLDSGLSVSDLAETTGLDSITLIKCKTGAVTSTVADRFQELFAFPRKPATQEEA